MNNSLNDYLDVDKVTNLLSYYGATQIRVEGEFVRCTCPIHKGHNPTSFVWNLKKHVWCCHSCGASGDLIRLHAIINDLSERNNFIEIVTVLCAMLGINKDDLNFDKMMNQQRKEVREWLMYTNRNIETNKEFDLNLLGTRQNISSYKMFDKSLLSDVFYAKDLNRIAFIIRDEDNKIIGASCRAVNQGEKIKWLHRPKGIDTGLVLYNLNNIKDKGYDSVYVVEGITDAINLIRLGINNVVCSFGCSLTDEQVDLLSKYFIKVIMFYDNDLAGIKGNVRTIEKLKNKFDLFVKYFGEFQINDAGEIKNIDEFNALPEVHYEKYLQIIKE